MSAPPGGRHDTAWSWNQACLLPGRSELPDVAGCNAVTASTQLTSIPKMSACWSKTLATSQPPHGVSNKKRHQLIKATDHYQSHLTILATDYQQWDYPWWTLGLWFLPRSSGMKEVKLTPNAGTALSNHHPQMSRYILASAVYAICVCMCVRSSSTYAIDAAEMQIFSNQCHFNLAHHRRMRIQLSYLWHVCNPATRQVPWLVLRPRINGVSTCVVLIFFFIWKNFMCQIIHTTNLSRFTNKEPTICVV
jgi:hypothetical protein